MLSGPPPGEKPVLGEHVRGPGAGRQVAGEQAQVAGQHGGDEAVAQRLTADGLADRDEVDAVAAGRPAGPVAVADDAGHRGKEVEADDEHHVDEQRLGDQLLRLFYLTGHHGHGFVAREHPHQHR